MDILPCKGSVEKGGSLKDVIWRDRKDSNDFITQTEFIVTDSKEDEDDNFLCKVIVYLTTGKVMVQGSEWEMFCDNYFNKCLNIVNDQIDICGKELSKDEETTPKVIEADSENKNEITAPPKMIQTKATIIKTGDITSATDKGSKNMNKTNEIHLNDFQQSFLSIQNRLDVIEDAAVKFSSFEKRINLSLSDFQKEIIKEIKSHTCDFNKIENKSKASETDLFIKQIKERDEMIKNLNKEINLMTQEHVNEVKTLKKSFEEKEVENRKSVESLKQQNMDLNVKLEKLNSIIGHNEIMLTQIKAQFEKQLSDKDHQIENLQDRLQNYLYDSKGNAWSKVESGP